MIPQDWTGVALLSVLFGCFSFIVNRKLGNRKRVKQIQEEVNKFNADLKKATQEKDEKKVKKLNGREEELSKLMTEMMMLSFKPLIVVLPLFWIAYAWLLPSLFPADFMVTLPFSVPSSLMFWLPWKDYLGYRGLFIYCLVIIGFALELIVGKLLKIDSF